MYETEATTAPSTGNRTSIFRKPPPISPAAAIFTQTQEMIAITYAGAPKLMKKLASWAAVGGTMKIQPLLLPPSVEFAPAYQ